MEPLAPKMSRELIECRQELFAYIYALTRNFESAEEVFQQVALEVLAQASAGKDVEQFLPWARGIARNLVAEHFSGKSRFEQFSKKYAEEYARVIEQSFENSFIGTELENSRKAKLAKCIDKLSAKARLILQYRYQDDLEVREVATRVGWTLGAVKVALARSRKALFECLSRSMDPRGLQR